MRHISWPGVLIVEARLIPKIASSSYVDLSDTICVILAKWWVAYQSEGFRSVVLKSGRTSSTGQGAWSRTKRATCPTDVGPIVGLPPYSARGQMATMSAFHPAAQLTI